MSRSGPGLPRVGGGPEGREAMRGSGRTRAHGGAGVRGRMGARGGHQHQQYPQQDRPHRDAVRPEACSPVPRLGGSASRLVGGEEQFALGAAPLDSDRPPAGDAAGGASGRVGRRRGRRPTGRALGSGRQRARRWPGGTGPGRGSPRAGSRHVQGERVLPCLVPPGRLIRCRTARSGHATVLFLVPTGLAGGLAPKERRYAVGDSPQELGSPASRQQSGAGIWLLRGRHPNNLRRRSTPYRAVFSALWLKLLFLPGDPRDEGRDVLGRGPLDDVRGHRPLTQACLL